MIQQEKSWNYLSLLHNSSTRTSIAEDEALDNFAKIHRDLDFLHSSFEVSLSLQLVDEVLKLGVNHLEGLGSKSRSI